MINYKFFLLIFIFIGCKEQKTQEISYTQKSVLGNSNIELKQEENHNLNEIRGLWESYSYYLEHESEFKDFNKDKFYIISNGKQELEITLKDQSIVNLKLNQYNLGFIDVTQKNSFVTEQQFLDNLKEKGATLVRLEKGLKDYNPSKIEISSGIIRDFDVVEILNNGFDYNQNSDDFNFKSLSALPKEVFLKLKQKSKQDNIDYIKDYNIYNLSSKVEVKVAKTFFYDEMNIDSKRKAFLIEGDIAYTEEINDDWVKIYYDSKILSSGYVKASEVKILP